MQRYFLKSKLHGVRITQANLYYEGSLSIDSAWLKEADIRPYEQVHVYNVTQGTRFVTYAIEAPDGSRTLCANGACAHRAKAGDMVIVCTYAIFEAKEWACHHPCVLIFDQNNHYHVKGKKSV